MATEVRLPELGENVTQADVVRVLVAVGDPVRKEQSILEIENEKAAVEVPSPVAGTVASIAIAEGDTVQVGALLMTLDEAEEEDQAGLGAGDADKAATVPARPAAAPATEHAAAPARASAPPATASRGSAPKAPAPAPPAGSPTRLVPAAPSVRRYARELGVDIGQVRGSGPHGRIGMDDVTSHARARLTGAAPSAGASAVAPPPLPDLAQWGPVERQPMSSVRRLTAQAMSRAWTVVPHVSHHDHADITDLEEARRRLGKRVEAAGGKLTVTAILVKVVAAALEVFPKFNAAPDPEHGEVVFRRYVNIGVAVDTPRGLLVPVVRDANRKSLLEVSADLKDLAERARTRRIGPDEMQGAGFTISNLGGIGGDAFAPIVNWPEVAVLGVSRGAHQPVWNGEAFVPRLILPLSLSYDHRLIDGADAARFLRWVCEALEEPLLISLGA